MKMTINIKSGKVCAFCRYWYDPTNSFIEPVNTRTNTWKFERDVKCKCMKSNLQMFGGSKCHHYECKVPIN